MCKIAEYYIIDALSCQQLMIKHNVINEYKEVTFISLFDTYYFAIGMKVSNLLNANTWWKGILISIILKQTETELFLDAYIFLSIKEHKNRHFVTGLNFASLYLSLIMTYNLLLDKIILSQKHADSLKESGKKLNKINFKFNDHDILT
ncbi:9853_t:CDS:1 [Funneliformis geosporum]|nr:9853_t:CDS:1 [Funneliformis geosporum]